MKTLKNIIFFILFCPITTLLSQTSTDNGVGFFNPPNDPNKQKQDSIFFHIVDTNMLVSLWGDQTYLNSTINFVDPLIYTNQIKLTSLKIKTNNCRDPLVDNKFGNHLFINSSVLELNNNTQLIGYYYLTFNNTIRNQTIYTSTSNPNLNYSINNIQINNPYGVDVQNANLKIGNNLNLYSGILTLKNNTLEMMSQQDAFFSCYNTKSYIVTENDSKIIRGNLLNKDNKEIPLGTKKYPLITKVFLKSQGIVGADNYRLGFNADSISPTMGSRLDESLDLTWKISNEDNNFSLSLDSMQMFIPDALVENRAKGNNTFFKRGSFISQYVGVENNTNGGDSSYTKWDKISLADFYSYRLSSTSRDGFDNQWGLFSRKNKLNLSSKISQYTITNLNYTPLSTKILNLNYNLDSIYCNLKLSWRATDLYYPNIAFGVYFTNLQKEAPSTLNGDFKVINSNEINYVAENLSTILDVSSVSSIVSQKKPIYFALYQDDKIGPRYYTDMKPIPLSCNALIAKSEDSTSEAVVYANIKGNIVYLNVEFVSKYTEDVNIKIYNILGELEADLGNYTVTANVNNLILQLPSHISRNQRYLISITGGILNTTLVKYTTTIFVP